MEIRTATEEDAEATIEFLREFRSEGLHTVLQHDGTPITENQKAFIRSHDGKNGIMLLCLKAGKVVGCLTADSKSHPQLRHSCEFGMGVLKHERGKGVGSALISRLAKWARAAGVSRLELCVFARNSEAIRLYRNLGFEVEGTRRRAVRISNAYEDIIEMAKKVEPARTAQRP